MVVNSLHKTVTLQRRSCDLNLNPTMPKSSTLTTHSRRPPTELAQLGSPELRAIKTVCVKLTVGLFYVLVCCDGCFCCVRFSF